MSNQLTIRLDDFEGPLDLLLHMIRTSEMDIYDIPIVEISDQYLNFLHSQEELSLDIAGEYLLMAATLLRIKSRYLLPNPKPEIDPETGEEIYVDPRAELINQLLEYRRFQEAAEELREHETTRALNYSRLPSKVPDDIELTLVAPGINLLDLQNAFANILQRAKENRTPTTHVNNETFTISGQITKIKNKIQTLSLKETIMFNELFEHLVVDEVVMTFLAILELAKYQQIVLSQENDNIVIEKGNNFDQQKINNLELEDNFKEDD